MDENTYKATWVQRAWFATGCTTLLVSLSKSILLFSKNPSSPRAWIHLIFAAALAYLLADLASGVYHWAIDNYGGAHTPIFGAQIVSFQAHHEHPIEVTKCESSRILYVQAIVTTAVLTPFNMFSGDPVLIAFVAILFGGVMLSIKSHVWAHVPKEKLPPLVAALQATGILIRMSQHKPHHRPPYNSTYCGVSGICNGILDKSKALARAEVAIFNLTGVRPRSWSQPISPKTPNNG